MHQINSENIFSLKTFSIGLGLSFLWSLEAFAQEKFTLSQQATWPDPQWIDPDTFRGPGFYFSIFRISACFALFLIWIRAADWINQDLLYHRLRRNTWNPIVVGCFAFALLMMWVIPYFWPAFFLLSVALVAPTLSYVFYYRNPLVKDHQRVLTPEHLKFLASKNLRFLGIGTDAEEPLLLEDNLGPEVDLFADLSPAKRDKQSQTILARQLEGYIATTELFGDALDRRASQLLLDFTENMGIRYLIDGVWHNLPSHSVETGRQITEVLSALATDPTNPEQSSFVQSSEADFSATFSKMIDSDDDSIKLDHNQASRNRFHGKWEEIVTCKLTLALGKNVERWLISFERSADHLHSLLDLGMRKKTVEEVTSALQNTKGMILFSALPAGGLTTLISIGLESVDRYMRDFVSVEDSDSPELEIANVDPKYYDSSAGERPVDCLPDVSRSQPDVIVCRKMVDSQSAQMLCELAMSDFLVISSIAARDSLEALLRVLVMKVPPELVAGSITTVVHGRLIRKLCPECKVSYRPSPELLKRLGIPPERADNLYRAAPPESKTFCEVCEGIGYHGITGVYEVLHMNQDIQKILVSGKPNIDDLKKVARKTGMHTELDHGKLLVARGITSVEELQRSLKK